MGERGIPRVVRISWTWWCNSIPDVDGPRISPQMRLPRGCEPAYAIIVLQSLSRSYITASFNLSNRLVTTCLWFGSIRDMPQLSLPGQQQRYRLRYVQDLRYSSCCLATLSEILFASFRGFTKSPENSKPRLQHPSARICASYDLQSWQLQSDQCELGVLEIILLHTPLSLLG